MAGSIKVAAWALAAEFVVAAIAFGVQSFVSDSAIPEFAAALFLLPMIAVMALAADSRSA